MLWVGFYLVSSMAGAVLELEYMWLAAEAACMDLCRSALQTSLLGEMRLEARVLFNNTETCKDIDVVAQTSDEAPTFHSVFAQWRFQYMASGMDSVNCGLSHVECGMVFVRRTAGARRMRAESTASSTMPSCFCRARCASARRSLMRHAPRGDTNVLSLKHELKLLCGDGDFRADQTTHGFDCTCSRRSGRQAPELGFLRMSGLEVPKR